jgi:hypothetical protein
VDAKTFLHTVITCPTGGYFCLAVSNGSGGWMEHWFRWPDDEDRILEQASHYAAKANVYFSSFLFRSPQSTKANVLPSRTIQADLDDADIRTLPREPTVLVETSPKRHQGFWVLEGDGLPLPLDEHEEISKKLTYSIPLCDRSGWPAGRKVRLPGTTNFKYLDGAKPVKILPTVGRVYSAADFEALPDVPVFLTEHFDDSFIENPPSATVSEGGVAGIELLEIIKDTIPVKVYIQYSQRQADRSESLWGLMCWGFRAGLSRDQVYVLARDSANNKHADLKSRGAQDLAKDVLRAEHSVKSNIQDDRQTITDIYKTAPNPLERKRAIFAVVLRALKEQGEFLHAQQGMAYYIRRDLGRPVSVSAHSQYLKGLLDLQFGLNPTEPEARYCLEGLMSHAYALPQTAMQSALSYYDPQAKHLLLHTGTKNVMRITASSIETVTDGAYNVIFPWLPTNEGFVPDQRTTLDWGQALFGDCVVDDKGNPAGSSVGHITNMTPDQAMALLKVWLVFVLFRNVARSRPIIAALGQPGGGKSLLFKKVYCLLYGAYKGIGSATGEESFDFATAYDPLYVLDNVDTWEGWLPDRLALAAGISDVTSRKKYTDGEPYTLRRQAVLGITAHNPKFGREDVADRFLMLAYKRLDHFASESEIISSVLAKRSQLWGAIVNDVQKVLNTPIPAENLPQFRIEDFAKYGLWIARGLGCEADFRSSIEDVKTSQQRFSLEEEGLLVASTLAVAARNAKNGEAKSYTASQLWAIMEGASGDSRAFASRYKSSVHLSKKLSSMQSSLKAVVNIEQSTAPGGNKLWTITQKQQ